MTQAPASFHTATFTIDLLVDAKIAQRTRIKHVQTGKERSWPGWDEKRLLNALMKWARLTHPRPARSKNKHKQAKQAQLTPDTSDDLKSMLMPPLIAAEWRRPQVRSMKVVQEGHSSSTQVIMNRQAFQIKLGLNMPALPDTLHYHYQAVVHAKRLGDGKRALVCERQGEAVIDPDGSATIDLNGTPLEPGTYRLTASITLHPIGISSSSDKTAAASLVEGMLLHVY